MTKYVCASEINDLLQCLVDKPLRYGIKSRGWELYDFGFGDDIQRPDHKGIMQTVCRYTLHVMCRFKVIWRNGERRVKRFYEDTPPEIFHKEVERLIGLRPKRVGLSDKNDLWLDFSDYWVVFATFEDGEESWRLFTPGSTEPHLVASDSWLQLDY